MNELYLHDFTHIHLFYRLDRSVSRISHATTQNLAEVRKKKRKTVRFFRFPVLQCSQFSSPYDEMSPKSVLVQLVGSNRLGSSNIFHVVELPFHHPFSPFLFRFCQLFGILSETRASSNGFQWIQWFLYLCCVDNSCMCTGVPSPLLVYSAAWLALHLSSKMSGVSTALFGLSSNNICIERECVLSAKMIMEFPSTSMK